MFRFGTRVKKLIAVLIALLMAGAVLAPVMMGLVQATGEEDLRQEQQDLSNQRQQTEDEIDALEDQKKSVMDEKKQLDEQVTALEGSISELEGRIAEDDAKIEQVAKELAQAEQDEQNQYEAYKKRMRVMYENGATTYINILLQSENIADFLNRIDIVKQIAEYDSNMLEKLKETKQQIQSHKDELDRIRQEKVDSLDALEADKSQLDSKKQERDQLIQQIEGSVSELEEQLKQIEAEEAAVRAQLRNLNSGSYVGGGMLWPSACKFVTSEFGWRLHPVLRYEKLHTGMDIGASYGTPYFAANDGTVVKATYNAAYGNYVVVDHGGGICTLYAHSSSLAVSVGQAVTRGQTLGYVGSTGYSTGPHLHFEVIVNGSVTDPRGYVSP